MPVSLMALREQAQTLTCANAGAPARWRFDERAIRLAIARLQIERPVELYGSNGRGGRSKYGIALWSSANAGTHRIGITRAQSLAQASRTIWHELEHARQDEQVPNFEREYAEQTRTVGYTANLYERQARSRANLADAHPLVLPW